MKLLVCGGMGFIGSTFVRNHQDKNPNDHITNIDSLTTGSNIKNLENIRYEINSMGTVLESDSMDVINNASKKMIETVHNLGVNRVEVIIKIDSRKDKHVKMEEKVESVKRQLD